MCSILLWVDSPGGLTLEHGSGESLALAVEQRSGMLAEGGGFPEVEALDL